MPRDRAVRDPDRRSRAHRRATPIIHACDKRTERRQRGARRTNAWTYPNRTRMSNNQTARTTSFLPPSGRRKIAKTAVREHRNTRISVAGSVGRRRSSGMRKHVQVAVRKLPAMPAQGRAYARASPFVSRDREQCAMEQKVAKCAATSPARQRRMSPASPSEDRRLLQICASAAV